MRGTKVIDGVVEMDGTASIKGLCRTCGEIKKAVHCPHCGWTACGDCWNAAGIIARCPNCGKRP